MFSHSFYEQAFSLYSAADDSRTTDVVIYHWRILLVTNVYGCVYGRDYGYVNGHAFLESSRSRPRNLLPVCLDADDA